MTGRRPVVKLAAVLLLSALVLTVLSLPLGPLPPLGDLLEPVGGFWAESESPTASGHERLSFASLEAPVDVYRDEHDVPHVFAESDADLFTAVGYLQAQDRLFQMDLQRRVAQGRLAEILGPSLVDTDLFLRELGITWGAERSLGAMDGETLAALEAYASGVNARMGEVSPHALPLEFKLLNYRPEAWTPLDSLTFAKYLGWTLSGSFEDLELALFRDAYGPNATAELFPVETPMPVPIIPEGEPLPSPPRDLQAGAELTPSVARELLARYAVLPFRASSDPAMGSNNWVVHGSRTATGAPILANDPHLGLTQPALFYLIRLRSPGYNVYGASLLGAPLVLLGFNEDIAWGFTNVGADVVDFFVEQVNPDNENEYLYRGQWKAFELREEVVEVRGGRSVSSTTRISVHGPVITSHGQTTAMQWTGHRPTNESRAIFQLDRASNWAEFRAALADFHVPAQNIVYADADGNIGLVVNGLYPVRGQGLGRFPVDGTTGDFDWMGFVPMDEVPASFNPAQGFLVSANQVPTVDTYPYYLGWNWADRYRTARINEVLGASDAVTVADVQALQLDHVSLAAREFVPLLLEAFEDVVTRVAVHPKESAALDRLREWDYEMRVELVAPTLYWRWLSNYRQATFGDEWDAAELEDVGMPSITVLEVLTKSEPDSPWFDDVGTPGTETRDTIMVNALVQTLEDLEEEIGPLLDDWEWGAYHRIQLRHLGDVEALSSAVLPRPGGSFTVDVAHGALEEDGVLVTSGPAWRLVADFAPALTGGDPVAWGVYPGGQSGSRLSDHYLDLFDLWMQGEYLDLRLTAAGDFADLDSSGGRY